MVSEWWRHTARECHDGQAERLELTILATYVAAVLMSREGEIAAKLS
jgi:hypothetical protein